MNDNISNSRRKFLYGIACTSALTVLGGLPAFSQPVRPAQPDTIKTKPIPSTGEGIPVIGMGTWITFNVGDNIQLRNERTQILQEFFNRGGKMVDCSPMYGSAADVLGYALQRVEDSGRLFSAEKVWTSWTNNGEEQMEEQRQSWGVQNFDLMQIHNLRNWKDHLETLREDKDKGKIRYIGITTSHGRRHDDLEEIMRTQDLDFVQLTYNMIDREVENRILPLAKERGIAVIANRPYRQKELFQKYQDKPLPAWAKEEAEVINWAEYFLKFIVSHPAVTCAIPATSQIQHIKENMGAAYGRMPDQKTRKRMAEYLGNV